MVTQTGNLKRDEESLEEQEEANTEEQSVPEETKTKEQVSNAIDSQEQVSDTVDSHAQFLQTLATLPEIPHTDISNAYYLNYNSANRLSRDIQCTTQTVVTPPQVPLQEWQSQECSELDSIRSFARVQLSDIPQEDTPYIYSYRTTQVDATAAEQVDPTSGQIESTDDTSQDHIADY